MTIDAFPSLVARLEPPLVVVTTASSQQRSGCLVGFHSQCSIDPMRYALWLSKANLTYRVALSSKYLAIHFLDAVDHDLAELFGGTTGDDVDKFSRCDFELGPDGVPLLTGCADRLVVARVALWDDGGDHACFVTEPLDVLSAPGLVPMRTSDAHDIAAGHPAHGTAPSEPSTPAMDDAPSDVDPSIGQDQHELEDVAAGAGHPVDLTTEDVQEPFVDG